ncbi:MAG: hypothetical protein Q4B70_13425 [Lachnospiraceae bacterium]|nr:hypothetical protein [Lachnospiraceae bacterium]
MERIFYVRPELSDEKKSELDMKLRLLSYDLKLSVTYFQQSLEFSTDIGTFHTVSGTLAFISPERKHMRIDNTEIDFADIVELDGDCFDPVININ